MGRTFLQSRYCCTRTLLYTVEAYRCILVVHIVVVFFLVLVLNLVIFSFWFLLMRQLCTANDVNVRSAGLLFGP